MIFRGIHRSDRPFSDPGGARTLDPLIKSQLLYQLSYGVISFVFGVLLCFWLLGGVGVTLLFALAGASRGSVGGTVVRLLW